MTEEGLFNAVTRLCDGLGFWWWHDNSKGDNRPGWLDLYIIGRLGVLIREIKSEEGRPSLAQLATIRRLTLAGQDVDIWRPSDLINGRIGRELSGLM